MDDIYNEVRFVHYGNEVCIYIPDSSWPDNMTTLYIFMNCKSEEEAKWLCENLNKALERIKNK